MEKGKEKKLFGTLLIVILLLNSCSLLKNNDTKIIRVVHGTSFGHCRGYCIKEETYSKKEQQYEKRGWDANQTKALSWEFETKKQEFESLVKRIDLAKFNELDSIIGCPDCADAGAEYLIIETKTGSRKVVFDAYSSPPGIEALLDYLREKRKALEIRIEEAQN
jgi:hypothetical protein